MLSIRILSNFDSCSVLAKLFIYEYKLGSWPKLNETLLHRSALRQSEYENENENEDKWNKTQPIFPNVYRMLPESRRSQIVLE